MRYSHIQAIRSCAAVKVHDVRYNIIYGFQAVKSQGPDRVCKSESSGLKKGSFTGKLISDLKNSLDKESRLRVRILGK